MTPKSSRRHGNLWMFKMPLRYYWIIAKSYRNQMLGVAILSWILTFVCIRHILQHMRERHDSFRSPIGPHKKFRPPLTPIEKSYDVELNILSKLDVSDQEPSEVIEYMTYTSPLGSAGKVTFTIPKVTDHHIDNENGVHNEFLVDQAEVISDVHRNIILIPVDEDELDIVVNFYELTLYKSGIDNYCFLMNNKENYNIVKSMGIHAFYYPSQFAITVDLPMQHDAFKRKTYFSVVYELLLRNYRVYLVSPFAILFRNVFSLRTDSAKAITIPLLPYISTDLVLLLPVEDVTLIVEETFVKLAERKIVHRAESNAVFASLLKNKISSGELTIGKFPLTFHTGKTIYGQEQNSGQMTVWLDESNAAVRQNHCERCHGVLDVVLTSKLATLFLLKESLFWLVDRDGYYSDPEGHYLMFNTIQQPGLDILESQLRDLKKALAIGIMLNRKVILPEFSCNGCSHLACRSSESCLISAHFDFVSFHNVFSEWFREARFFFHPKLHINIKLSHVQDVILTNGTKDIWFNKGNIVINPKGGRLDITTKEIHKHLLDVRDPVLELTFLPDTMISFSNSKEQAAFDAMIQKAFVYLHHRQ